MIYDFDVTVFRWLNSWVFWQPWLDAFIIFLAQWFGTWVVAGLLLFGVVTAFENFSHRRRRHWELVGVALAAAVVARFGLIELVRLFSDRPRPFEVLSDLHELLAHSGTSSFPSGHAAFYFAIAAVVSRYYPRTGILVFLAAGGISLARVAAGLHWPSDIVAGAIIGIVVGYLLPTLWKHFYARPRHPDR